MIAAKLSYINVTDKGNCIGYINVQGEPVLKGKILHPVEDLYFIRLLSEDESQLGEIEDFTFEDYEKDISTKDGKTYRWLKLK